MVKKLQKLSADKKKSASSLADSVKESAQQIWLAGLGAFSKAQEERGKLFDTLVKEGLSIQRKTQAAAEEKISEATNRVAGMASGFSAKAGGIGSLASGQWDKLENIFEERVAKALNKLGVPTAKEVAALAERVEALNQSVQQLSGKSPVAKPAGKTAASKKAVAQPVAEAAAPASKPVRKPATKAVTKPVKAAVKAVEPAVAPVAAKRPAARKKPAAVVPAVPAAAAPEAAAPAVDNAA